MEHHATKPKHIIVKCRTGALFLFFSFFVLLAIGALSAAKPKEEKKSPTHDHEELQ